MVSRRVRAGAFRVYDEDEFFALGGSGGELSPESVHRDDRGRPSGGVRAAAALALAGASAAVLLAFALGTFAPIRHGKRKAALRAALPNGGRAPGLVERAARLRRARPRRVRLPRPGIARAPRASVSGSARAEEADRTALEAPAGRAIRPRSASSGREEVRIPAADASSETAAVAERGKPGAIPQEFGFER